MYKRLYRSGTNKVLFGVAGGLSEYLNIDPVLLRIAFVILSFAWGASIIIYILLAIILPVNYDFIYSKDNDINSSSFRDDSAEEYATEHYNDSNKRNFVGIVLIALGVGFLLVNIFEWINFWNIMPLFLVAIGVGIMLKTPYNKRNINNRMENEL